eukprot:COSAG06_NODE_40769_length_398_cov_3.672241_1_plen_96_part_01
MRVWDKIPSRACGELVHTKNKIEVDPSKHCLPTMKRNHDTAVHFSRNNDRQAQLDLCAHASATRTASTSPDYCGTRIAAKHKMLLGNLKLRFALDM